jgi:hypothetical protein
VGSPLARQDAHLLDDRQSFMEASHPPIPFDQPCLVALFFLSSHLIPNYGEQYRNGEVITTSFVESTVNQVVSKRFCKCQQIQ